MSKSVDASSNRLGRAPNGRRLSDVLTEIANDSTRERIRVRDLLNEFGDRAFGPLIFFFAAPNVMPITAPGFSAVLGAPLLFLTWQLMIGRPHPWLPNVIAARSMTRHDFDRLVRQVVPVLQRVERFVRPRFLLLAHPVCERFIGLAGFVLAIIIFLPIPLGNLLPGFALALFALGILERDGAAIIVGSLAAIISVVLVAGVLYGFAQAAVALVHNTFGL